jgi:uncharacterized protein YbjT (DUF2867 family)
MAPGGFGVGERATGSRAMKFVVMGANGTLGRAIVERLTQRGHETIAVTRNAPKRAFMKAVLRTADVVTGEGVADAVRKADVVINAVNAEKDARTLLVEGTKKLLEACEANDVKHYVAVSIVGIDLVPMKYYAIKLEEEGIVESQSKTPWSLLRATQFHNLVDMMFARAARFGFVLAPSGAKMQPIDVGEVATALIEAGEKGPNKRLPDLGGPEVLLMKELAQQWLKATKKTRLIMPAPVPGKFGASLRAGGLCAPDRALGKRTFSEWATDRYGH